LVVDIFIDIIFLNSTIYTVETVGIVAWASAARGREAVASLDFHIWYKYST